MTVDDLLELKLIVTNSIVFYDSGRVSFGPKPYYYIFDNFRNGIIIDGINLYTSIDYCTREYSQKILKTT